jgi:hypothetical protein
MHNLRGVSIDFSTDIQDIFNEYGLYFPFFEGISYYMAKAMEMSNICIW